MPPFSVFSQREMSSFTVCQCSTSKIAGKAPHCVCPPSGSAAVCQRTDGRSWILGKLWASTTKCTHFTYVLFVFVLYFNYFSSLYLHRSLSEVMCFLNVFIRWISHLSVKSMSSNWLCWFLWFLLKKQPKHSSPLPLLSFLSTSSGMRLKRSHVVRFLSFVTLRCQKDVVTGT